MNRYIILLLLIGFNIFSCEKDPLNYEISLIWRDGIYYSKDTNLPYNGPVFSVYESGEIKTKGRFKDGKAHGLSINWYKNEKKQSELNFKNGLNNGLQTFWYQNGEKKKKGIILMEQEMDYGLLGIKMGKNIERGFSRMINKMDYGLLGTKMGKKKKKEILLME